MINELRKPTTVRRAARPLWMRFAGGVAAAFLFGVIGASTFYVMGADGLLYGRTESANHLKRLASTYFSREKFEGARDVAFLDDSKGTAASDEPRGIRLWKEGKNEGGIERDHIEGERAETLTPDLNVPISNSTFNLSTRGMAKPFDMDEYSRQVHGHIQHGANGVAHREPDGRAMAGLGLAPGADRTAGKLEDKRSGMSRAGNGEHALDGVQPGYYYWGVTRDGPKKVPSAGAPSALPPTNGPADPSFAIVGSKLGAASGGGGVVAGGTKKPDSVSESSTPERKIIRTGEMEFEIEKYDDAAATIGRLTDGVKGAYIEADDSTRQANNKKRGVIVVRVPPGELSKFVANLRAELGKMGELKSQRLGSQDVSKQYIDTEGNLRVAKAMELRILEIIKNPKGEIKDLIAAENALGEWRTKIERMVGELRYYDKQIALGTISITLYEKDIQAPASLVVTEKIGMRIEVEEVEKAHAAALTAIAEAKGRVTKSELKQFTQGHMKAFIHVEVAPAAAGPLSDQLKKLGIVTHHDATRLQETKGGSGRSPELKPNVSDVVFEIELYNAANIQPREAVKMLIATLDVPGNYRKLQEAVAKVKGQVRDGKLNEIDKLRIEAHFDFDILASDKPAIDKLIAEVGPLFSRSIEQAPVNELATDRRVGYRLTLRNVAGIPWREKITLTIEVGNVEAKAAELKQQVVAAQGIVAFSKLQHETNGTSTSALVFEVPLGANEVLVSNIKKSGTVRSQQAVQNPAVPDNELATARIEVTLTNAGPIVPSDEGIGAQIRTGLYYSFRFFSWCIIFVITGVLVVLPCVMAVMFIVKLIVWMWRKTAVKAA